MAVLKKKAVFQNAPAKQMPTSIMPRQSGIAGAETQNTSGINHSGLYKRESGGLYGGDKVVTNLGNQQVAPSSNYQNGGGKFESPA